MKSHTRLHLIMVPFTKKRHDCTRQFSFYQLLCESSPWLYLANSWDHPLNYFILYWVSKLQSNLSNGSIRDRELEFGQLQAGELALYAFT